MQLALLKEWKLKLVRQRRSALRIVMHSWMALSLDLVVLHNQNAKVALRVFCESSHQLRSVKLLACAVSYLSQFYFSLFSFLAAGV